MPYLVRKLAKRDNLSILDENADVSNLSADLPTAEFRTKSGKLSTWYIDSLSDVDNAVLAMAITSSDISSKMDLIVMSTDMITKNDLAFKQTYAGQELAIPDLQDTHYDIIDITVEKLKNCIKIYQTIYNSDPNGEKFIKRYTSGEIKDLLRTASKEKRIDETKTTTNIKEQLDKIFVNPVRKGQ